MSVTNAKVVCVLATLDTKGEETRYLCEYLEKLSSRPLVLDMGVTGAPALLKRFVHSGNPSDIPEYLHVGGWQVLNVANIDSNLNSICAGLQIAADRGIQLLVTSET